MCTNTVCELFYCIVEALFSDPLEKSVKIGSERGMVVVVGFINSDPILLNSLYNFVGTNVVEIRVSLRQ